jgi:hypothetical protein
MYLRGAALFQIFNDKKKINVQPTYLNFYKTTKIIK